MAQKKGVSRRHTLQRMGAFGAVAWLGSKARGEGAAGQAVEGPGRVAPAILDKVFDTAFVDTHEHLIEEKERLAWASRMAPYRGESERVPAGRGGEVDMTGQTG